MSVQDSTRTSNPNPTVIAMRDEWRGSKSKDYLEHLKRVADGAIEEYVAYPREEAIYFLIETEFTSFVCTELDRIRSVRVLDWKLRYDGSAHTELRSEVEAAALQAWPPTIATVAQSMTTAMTKAGLTEAEVSRGQDLFRELGPAALERKENAETDATFFDLLAGLAGPEGDLLRRFLEAREHAFQEATKPAVYTDQLIDDMWASVRRAAVREVVGRLVDTAEAAGGFPEAYAFFPSDLERHMLERSPESRDFIIRANVADARLEGRIIKERL
ncbi:hypothetical protein GCM10023171_10740 [Microbacterium panaciterrae]|uniref:Uncharacterized protein n=2 Tax=Microbacterium panaciterrae TaxID=985759 RepID=A0ABP8P7H9_9MICO